MVVTNPHRRSVLKALGAGSVVTAVNGTATGNDHEGDGDGEGGERRECPRPDCIHPVLGYVGLSPDETVPDPLQPDHEVELLIRPREGSEAEIPEFFFEPTGLFVESGDVVRFTLATPDHTVTAYHPHHGRQRRVPEGVPPLSSPVLGGGAFWLYRFDEPGVYDLLCAPHEAFGMVARIVVDEPTMDFGEADPAGGRRPPELTAALVYEDPALDPQRIADAGEVSWDELADESKQLLIEFAEPADERTASLEVGDQSGDGETVVVDEAGANVDYYVDVHYEGETARSETFDANTTQERVEIALDPPLTEDATIDIGVHAAEDEDEITGETIRYEVE